MLRGALDASILACRRCGLVHSADATAVDPSGGGSHVRVRVTLLLVVQCRCPLAGVSMTIAALYDIHGNLPALDAVLAELQREPVDAIVVGGDVVPGPLPRETLARLLAMDIPVHFIVGNGELAVLAQPVHGVGERHVGPGDRRGPGTAVCLDHVTVQCDRVLAERGQVDTGAQ